MLLDDLIGPTEMSVGNRGSRGKEFSLFFSPCVSEDELCANVPTADLGCDDPPVLRVL